MSDKPKIIADLLRAEVVDHMSDRLYGEVVPSHPLQYKVYVHIILALVAISLVLLLTDCYTWNEMKWYLAF